MSRNIRKHYLAQYKKWICNYYSYLKWNWPHNVVSSVAISIQTEAGLSSEKGILPSTLSGKWQAHL